MPFGFRGTAWPKNAPLGGDSRGPLQLPLGPITLAAVRRMALSARHDRVGGLGPGPGVIGCPAQNFQNWGFPRRRQAEDTAGVIRRVLDSIQMAWRYCRRAPSGSKVSIHLCINGRGDGSRSQHRDAWHIRHGRLSPRRHAPDWRPPLRDSPGLARGIRAAGVRHRAPSRGSNRSPFEDGRDHFRAFPRTEDRHDRRRSVPESRQRGTAALQAANHACDARSHACGHTTGNSRPRRRLNAPPRRDCYLRARSRSRTTSFARLSDLSPR